MTGLQNGRDPARADFDWRRFAAELRRRQRDDGRALRPIADAAGVTVTDLSRALGGQIVSTAKVFALCDWLGRDARAFYLPPMDFASRAASAALPPGAPAGREAVRDGRPALPAPPDEQASTESSRCSGSNVERNEGA